MKRKAVVQLSSCAHYFSSLLFIKNLAPILNSINTFCQLSTAPVTVLPALCHCSLSIKTTPVDTQILCAFLTRTLCCHFLREPALSSVEVSLSLHCRLCDSNTYNEIRLLICECQYLTSMHKIHFCNKRRSESCPCFLWKVMRLSLWPWIWAIANHWCQELW